MTSEVVESTETPSTTSMMIVRVRRIFGGKVEHLRLSYIALSDPTDKDRIHNRLLKQEIMNKQNSKHARSMVLTAIVVAAIATTIMSALYVGGIVGHTQSKDNTSTSSSNNSLISPGGFMLVRNATSLPRCLSTSTTTVNDTTTTNDTSTTTSMTCIPIGMG